MRLYLDDDCASKALIHLLVAAGHDGIGPTDVGLTGVDDPYIFGLLCVRSV